MRTSLLFVFVIVGMIPFGSPAPGAEELTKAESALASYAFEGVQLGDTFASFDRKFPVKMVNEKESNEKLGVRCYVALVEGNEVAGGFHFFEGKVYEIDVYYPAERIEKMGGKSAQRAILDTLVETYGNYGVTPTWNLPKVHRRLKYVAPDSGGVLFTVTDTAAEEKVNQKYTHDLKQQLEKLRLNKEDLKKLGL